MKKTTKNIIIALVALLVLGGAVAALILTQPQAEEETSESSESSTATEALIEKTVADIERIAITSAETGETLNIIPTKTAADVEANDTFTVEGWEDEDVVTANVMSLARSFYSVTPTKSLGALENLSEYGLAGDGTYKGVVTYTDGTSDTLIFGVEAGESYGRYLLYNGEVYICSVSTYLSQSPLAFINTSLITIANPTVTDEEGNESEGTSTMDSMRLSGTNFPEPIELELSDDDILIYELTAPIHTGANTTKTETIMTALQTVTATGVVAVDATDEQIAQHGLDEPAAVVEYTINGESHTIRLGDKVSGIYGMMVDDRRTIYTIASETVTEWADATLYTMRDGYVILPNIQRVQQVSVTAADGTDVYNVTRVENEEKSTETSKYYDLTVEKDGEAIDYTNYQPFYRTILSVALLNEDIREPEGDPVLSYTYTYFDGGSDTVAYYLDSTAERRYIVTLNGEATGIVRASAIDEILTAKPLLAQNKSIEGEEEESAAESTASETETAE